MAVTYKKLNYIGFNAKILNTEFKLKLTPFDFDALFEGLNLKTRRGILYFDDLFEDNKNNV